MKTALKAGASIFLLVLAFVITMGGPTAAQQKIQLIAALPSGSNVVGGVTLRDSGNNHVTDSTAHAVKFLPVDSTGAAVDYGVDATEGNTSLTSGPQLMCNSSVDVSGHTAQTDGKTVKVACDSLGRALVGPHCDRTAAFSTVTDLTSTTTSTSAVTAGGAGVYLEVWAVGIGNSGATDANVSIQDGVSGTTKAKFPAPQGFGGAIVPLPQPFYSSANTALAVQSSASSDTVSVTLIGCKVK